MYYVSVLSDYVCVLVFVYLIDAVFRFVCLLCVKMVYCNTAEMVLFFVFDLIFYLIFSLFSPVMR